MLYHNMSIYCNTLGAIYRYGKIQYRPSSNDKWVTFHWHLVQRDTFGCWVDSHHYTRCFKSLLCPPPPWETSHWLEVINTHLICVHTQAASLHRECCDCSRPCPRPCPRPQYRSQLSVVSCMLEGSGERLILPLHTVCTYLLLCMTLLTLT